MKESDNEDKKYLFRFKVLCILITFLAIVPGINLYLDFINNDYSKLNVLYFITWALAIIASIFIWWVYWKIKKLLKG